MRRVDLALLGLLSVAGCGTAEETQAPDETSDVDERRDSESGQFLRDGKTDSNGVEERSWSAQCVLNVANEATLEQLDDDMSLWSFAAQNIVDGRPYGTIEEVDDVSWVGPYAFWQMEAFAEKNELCPGLGEEYPPAGEVDAILAVTQASVDHVNKKWGEGERPSRRDAHPKAHGCVKAFFEVEHEADVPESMKVGVFAEEGTRYPAWIRFSNGSFTISPDPEGDIRGMAIKLMQVPGDKVLEAEKDAPTQDFLLINTPVLMVRNAIDYVEFSQKAFDGNPVSFFFDLNPLEWNMRELWITISTLGKDIASPLLSRYWSTTPYQLGDAHAVKYSARPCGGESDEEPKDAGDNYLSEVLADHLAENEACFEFLVQVQTDAEEMPIEDPSLEWDDDDSPYLKVATIKIPSQTFLGDAQKDFCEHLSYNPWHTLPEHTPLGGINRTRKVVYDAISALRHGYNEQPRIEPNSHEIPALD
ncbi:MAG: catalase family protein [Bradymonadia bacterium]